VLIKIIQQYSVILETDVSGPLFLAGAALTAACLNLFVALALVSVSLLLGLPVRKGALLCDRGREVQSVRLKVEQRVAR
jgi:hypothetical protein